MLPKHEVSAETIESVREAEDEGLANLFELLEEAGLSADYQGPCVGDDVAN